MQNSRWALALLLAGGSPLVGARHAAAQVELPRESPPARVAQQVGLTEISLEYASPAVKGRRIWGTLVPYEASWSISPVTPTTIRFSRDVRVGGQPVPAGTYRLSAIPGRQAWTFLLARIAGPEGAPVRVKSVPHAAP